MELARKDNCRFERVFLWDAKCFPFGLSQRQIRDGRAGGIQSLITRDQNEYESINQRAPFACVSF